MERILRNKGARTGLFFGATSGVITTIGLIAGLNAGTNSMVAVLGGILVVAVADAMSDTIGIHLAQESDPIRRKSTYGPRRYGHSDQADRGVEFCAAAPVAARRRSRLGWMGTAGDHLLSAYLARVQGTPVLNVVTEHVVIAIVVVAVSHFIGVWVNVTFLLRDGRIVGDSTTLSFQKSGAG